MDTSNALSFFKKVVAKNLLYMYSKSRCMLMGKNALSFFKIVAKNLKPIVWPRTLFHFSRK
jgi:hypothetical protein